MKAKNEISERFLNVISYLSLKDYEIWKSIDEISKEQLSKIRRGVNGASIKVIDAFCNAYPEASKIYILTGEGSPLKDATAEEEKLPSKRKRRLLKEGSSDSSMIVKALETLIEDMDLLKKQNEALMREILELKKSKNESKEVV